MLLNMILISVLILAHTNQPHIIITLYFIKYLSETIAKPTTTVF